MFTFKKPFFRCLRQVSYWVNRVFVNWHIWHFCHSCTKLTSWGVKISKEKIASTGYWTHNTNPTIKIPATLPTQPICQSMPVSNFQTLLKSCSIEPEMIQVQFKDILFNKCLGGWVVKLAGILIVGLVLWVQYPVEAIFFLLILKSRDVNFVQEWQKCQICQFTKNSNGDVKAHAENGFKTIVHYFLSVEVNNNEAPLNGTQSGSRIYQSQKLKDILLCYFTLYYTLFFNAKYKSQPQNF